MLDVLAYIIGFIGVTVGLGVSIWNIVYAPKKYPFNLEGDDE